MRMKRIPGVWRIILCGLVWGGLLGYETPVVHAAEPITTLPPNFQLRTVASGLQLPTDMALMPSGDILIAEKGRGLETDGVANIRLVHQGVLLDEPVLSLSVTSLGDSGIYSLVLDPAFASNHFFYVWYSVGKHAVLWTGKSVDRLSRFKFDPVTGKADAASETIILNNIRWSQWHNGGGIAFDTEGNLFIATGDAASMGLGQNMASLNGKLLRIRPLAEGGYSVPSNPAPANGLPEIYASGLRNPFRIARNPVDQEFYLIDVGAGTWEEVNRIEAGANYGWAVREGPCAFGVRDPGCPPAPPEYTDPVVSYPHPPSGGAGITALAFYSGTVWPASYQGKLFYADFNWGTMSMVDLADPKTIIPFAEEIGHLVDLEATADGLYLLSIYEGTLSFLYYSEGGNQWPTAQIRAVPQQGVAPLDVQFSGAGSVDPENDALVYLWDWDDGSAPVTTTAPVTTHRYISDGNYLASLQVTDAQGGKSEVRQVGIQVYSGAMPTIVQEITGIIPDGGGRERYRGGDVVRFSVQRAGGNIGLDATTPYRWSIKQHHNQHIHFVITEHAGDEVVLNISDDSHGAEVSIWYEAELTMLTDQGQEVRVARMLYPDVVVVDVQSSPSGAWMWWESVRQPSDQPISAIVGQRYTLEAPLIYYAGRTKNRFLHWQISDEPGGGEGEIIAERAIVVEVGEEGKHYLAVYENIAPAEMTFLPRLTYFSGAPGR